MNHINSQLYELYTKHWPNLLAAASSFHASDTKPANPLLLKLNEERYELSDLKIMYCGQETFGWCETLDGRPIEKMTSTYERYFTNEGYLKTEAGKRAFWRATRKFNASLESAFPERTIYPIWNNISKIGIANRKGMTDKIRQLERANFLVFREELALLKPDLVIFMTGPNRDGDIKFNLPDAKFEAASEHVNKRSLARVTTVHLKRPAVRIYHPAYYGGFNRISGVATAEFIKILKNDAL